MGIFIYLSVTKSVTKEEWKAVYEESLKMATAFPLADRRKVKIDGIDTVCLIKPVEFEETYGWREEESIWGWNAIGDYECMCTGEDYFLPRDLVEDSEYMEECEDVIFGMLPEYLNYDWKDKRFDFTYELWGGKTQGEPYHMFILAIGCMIESRLGRKALVYGDITKGQCTEAVKLANGVLDDPINMPDRCDPERLMVRVDSMPISEEEKIRLFERIYLGNKGKEFGEHIQISFSGRACREYWKKRFETYSVDQLGFDSVFNDYLLWGFDFDKIFEFVKFENKEGISLHEEFVKRVLDAKLHLEEKDCSDPLKIDQDETSPFSIYTYFAQFAFVGARNKKIDRYIPLEDIREALVKGIGDKCDVDRIIDEYLQKESKQKKTDISGNSTDDDYIEACEQDSSDVFKQFMDIKRDQLERIHDKYDVSEYEELMFYESGDSIHPGIMKSLGKLFSFYNSILEEDTYKKLMKKTSKKRCEFLVMQNRSVLIRDQDWRKIFRNIKKNKKSFARYYPMVRIMVNKNEITEMIKGIILNDELYAYCSVLAEKYGNI